MASKRSIPTDLFWDETFSAFNGEIQSIFFGLMLGADDYGRGPAGVSALGRMLAKDVSLIQAALQELCTTNFLQCYQVEGKDYYFICQWGEWETLHKPARSRYPAPPDRPDSVPSEQHSNPLDFPGKSGKIQTSPGTSGKIRPEAEAEEKQKEAEAEGPEYTETVIPFRPRSGGDGGDRQKEGTTDDPRIIALATILQIPVSPALARLLTEFPDLQLLGEADAARAWLQDQHGKRKQQQMTLPFFRRWLQRSQTIHAQTQAATETSQGTGTTGRTGPVRLPSLMDLDKDRRKGDTRR